MITPLSNSAEFSNKKGGEIVVVVVVVVVVEVVVEEVVLDVVTIAVGMHSSQSVS